ncbi:hypothetical protein BOX15_Mlig000621g3 [Macrostomum lignano]|uniref:Synapsin ATP-binding domain-containing protein n=1 Tax=Macrostomum lignano TaxID=282301 RepID=A0A267H8I1_9PLAT|nr:hypothetical protein BOX15_Mlig000621g3 [Macrostomum lignano]
MHAGVPTINSAMALFNCSERAWLFAHLAQIQSRVGDDNFPLIEQNYFPCYQDLEFKLRANRSTNFMDVMQQSLRQIKTGQTVAQDNFPMAMKIGHAHSGLGKIKISGPDEYRDLSGALAVAGTYATTEALVDAKFDIHIQKIGAYYKAYARRSISGSWKANVSSAMLEQLNMTDKFRQWIDEVARLFGGLDICSVETVQHKNGRVFIIEANGSDMPLIGDSQEEDRRAIAELTLSRMHHACSEAAVLAAQRAKSQQPLGDQQQQQQQQQQQKVNGASTPESSDRRRQQQQPRPQQMQNSLDEGDDTMRNLRKTFAGIFGDM